jgi:hypothetical protein
MEEQEPITPLTGPVFDAEGRLTYVGVDGRRYVVEEGGESDPDDGAQVMEALKRGGPVLEAIERGCRCWLEGLRDSALSDKEALALLLATLETVLERGDGKQLGG